jgi:tight adherence protein B
MMALFASLATVLVLSGLILGVQGIRKVPIAPSAARRKSAPLLGRRFSRLSKRTRILLLAGLATGLLTGALTGWLVAIIILPLAAVGIPFLLSAPESSTKIDRLEAMEEWTRSLSGVLTVGYGLEQALIATLRSTPAPIRPEVSTLVARLRARWSTAEALRAFADDLDDATGDLVAANLLLGAQRRGPGLASVLEGLAESVSADVRARRDIEAGRATPRATARWITIITIGTLTLLAFSGTYIKPYGSPLGQVILIALLTCFVSVLMWMRSMAKGDKLPRFIGQAVAEKSRA